MSTINPIELANVIKLAESCINNGRPFYSSSCLKLLANAAKERLQQLKGGDVSMRKIADQMRPACPICHTVHDTTNCPPASLTSPEPVIATGRGEVIETPRLQGHPKNCTCMLCIGIDHHHHIRKLQDRIDFIERSLITAEKERDELKEANRVANKLLGAQAQENDSINSQLLTDAEKLKSQLSAAEKARDDYATEIYRLAEELEGFKNNHGMSCMFTGPGRGDCANFIGLPGKSIPGMHDGKDDTVDCYGRPNGWCWPCWKDYRLDLSYKLAQSLVDKMALIEHATNNAFGDSEAYHENAFQLSSEALHQAAEQGIIPRAPS